MILRIKPLLLPALFIIACCTKTETTPTPPPAPDPVPVDSVTVSPAAFSLVAYDSIRLAAKVFPDSAADNKPVWISSNPSVATVDSCGMVRALAFGSVEITASAGGKTASSRGFIEKFSSFELMTVDPLTKILRKAVEKEMDYPLDVARGETATVQVRIFANARTSDLTAELLYFSKEGSAAGTLLEPKMYWEREVFCAPGWDTWAGGAPTDVLQSNGSMFPDPLMPLDKWHTALNPEGQTQKDYEKLGLWCEFEIPRGFEDGNYNGRIRVSGKSGGKDVSEEVDFTIRVYPVTLPESQSLTVNNWNSGVWGDNLKYMNNGVIPKGDDKNECNSIIRRFMNGYGSNVWRINDARPDNGAGSENGISAVSVVNGALKFDFDLVWGEEMRRILADTPDLKMINGTPWMTMVESPAGSGKWVGKCNVKWVCEDGSLGSGAKEITDPVAQAYVSEYFRQLQAYLESQMMPDGRHSWLDCFAQSIFDEPNSNTYEVWNCAARAIKNGGDRIKTLEAICTNPGELESSLIDYPCPKLNRMEAMRATGEQTQWMYVCIEPQGDYANRFTLLPLMKVRILHWCNYYYDAPGFLHWGLNFWDQGGPDAPYGNQKGIFPGGDAWIIFPGYREVYPSIRLCAERDGIRDYELLKMVEAVDPGKASEFCRKIVMGPASYNTNISNFRKVRKDILTYLSE